MWMYDALSADPGCGRPCAVFRYFCSFYDSYFLFAVCNYFRVPLLLHLCPKDLKSADIWYSHHVSDL